jgi:hypothetical protein
MHYLLALTKTALIAILLATALSCSNSVPVSFGIKPDVLLFSGNPIEIDSGKTTTLEWKVAGATSVTIDNGIGKVSNKGSRTVRPKTSTNYTLTAVNSSGSINQVVTILVYSASATSPYIEGAPVIETFDVSPDIVPRGQSSTLHWNVTGATSVHINNLGFVPPVGSIVVSPEASIMFVIIASNEKGSVSKSHQLTIKP